MTEIVLALNAGSSTLKCAAYRMIEGHPRELWSDSFKTEGAAPGSGLELTLERLRREGLPVPASIGHRVVHGGPKFTAPTVIDGVVLAELEKLVPLAPLHQPPALALIRAALELWPNARHVACFDTAFHRTLPEMARRLPLPTKLDAAGIHRYGFHGLSCEFVLSELGVPPPARLLVAHLGSGASITAVRDGQSIDTTMGLTPTGGIPMGTRTGDLDPGVLLHLLRERGFSLDQLDRLVNHEAGLTALAGSAEVSVLLARASTHDAAALSALRMFAYAIRKQIGAYFAALGGLDCLVFTGGIGENAPLVRELACQGLQALGIELEDSANLQSAPLISSKTSRCLVRVVRTNEALVIARAAYALGRGTGSSG
ncbi:MAG TPA: acetate/propionate family kinase [Polyangiaceae bacterium]|nr:acetate/propionate family kinase [Polyangiaceae bacterium]